MCLVCAVSSKPGRHAGDRLELPSALRLLLESANNLNPPRLRESSGQIEECLDRGGLPLERPPQGLDQLLSGLARRRGLRQEDKEGDEGETDTGRSSTPAPSCWL